MFEQDIKTRFNRCFITCFNMDKATLDAFKLPKSKGSGSFELTYIDAAFNLEAQSVEMFMEFNEKVWDNKLIEQLEKAGACQVFVTTFSNNDGNNSATSALARVWESADKHGSQYTKGVCSEPLLIKAKSKLAEMQAPLKGAEADEKMKAAIKMSLADMENKIDNVGDKVDNVEGKIDNMHNRVCNIIPDYQMELKELKEKLAHKTKEVDRIEYYKGLVTKERNQLREQIYQIQDEANDLRAKNQMFVKELATKDALIDSLQYISEFVCDAKRARTTK